MQCIESGQYDIVLIANYKHRFNYGNQSLQLYKSWFMVGEFADCQFIPKFKYAFNNELPE